MAKVASGGRSYESAGKQAALAESYTSIYDLKSIWILTITACATNDTEAVISEKGETRQS